MMKVLRPTKLMAAAALAFGVLASPLAHAAKDVDVCRLDRTGNA